MKISSIYNLYLEHMKNIYNLNRFYINFSLKTNDKLKLD